MLELIQVISLILVRIVNRLIQPVILRCMLNVVGLGMSVNFVTEFMHRPANLKLACTFRQQRDLLAVIFVIRKENVYYSRTTF